ncbi:hypothetical protein [Peribacillus muralis]|uniref:hypothetical protein n=1 Tax=Peribacillus muralis TaxID=264697 RepID=UPI00366E7257
MRYEVIDTWSPKNQIAHEVSKEPSKGKEDNVVVSIQKTLNSRYRCNLIVWTVFLDLKLSQPLSKALQTELNKQFNKKLVVDGNWGPKTKAAIVSIEKGAKGNLTWILQAALYMEDLTLDHWIPS